MIFYTSLIVCAVIILIFMLKKMSLKKVLLSLFSGVASLFAADIMLSLYGSNMPVNIHTLLISSLGGMPGTILLILLKTFFA